MNEQQAEMIAKRHLVYSCIVLLIIMIVSGVSLTIATYKGLYSPLDTSQIITNAMTALLMVMSGIVAIRTGIRGIRRSTAEAR